MLELSWLLSFIGMHASFSKLNNWWTYFTMIEKVYVNLTFWIFLVAMGTVASNTTTNLPISICIWNEDLGIKNSISTLFLFIYITIQVLSWPFFSPFPPRNYWSFVNHGIHVGTFFLSVHNLPRKHLAVSELLFLWRLSHWCIYLCFVVNRGPS